MAKVILTFNAGSSSLKLAVFEIDGAKESCTLRKEVDHAGDVADVDDARRQAGSGDGRDGVVHHVGGRPGAAVHADDRLVRHCQPPAGRKERLLD